MIVKNTITGEDVTKYCLQYLKDEINQDEFEKRTGLDARNMLIDIKYK
jgi:hypothetical protein